MQTPDQYFDSLCEGQDFDRDVIEGARKYFHEKLERGILGRTEAAHAAWHYANGLQAAKLMAA